MRGTKALIALCALASAMPAQARYVGPGYDKSWGKAGVSFADYRDDSISCGRQAAALDLQNTGPAKSFALASRLIDNAPDLESVSHAMWIASPDRNFHKAGDLLQDALEQCLRDRGYHKFKLSAEQRHRLRKLPIGSDARHHYLYSLATDPEVQAHQAIQ